MHKPQLLQGNAQHGLGIFVRPARTDSDGEPVGLKGRSVAWSRRLRLHERFARAPRDAPVCVIRCQTLEKAESERERERHALDVAAGAVAGLLQWAGGYNCRLE